MNKDNKLAPVTFRIPFAMTEKINQLIKTKQYKSKAAFVREAVENFIIEESSFKKTDNRKK